jgi:ParB family transcriptional regulator, chromosome partitioning protein
MKVVKAMNFLKKEKQQSKSRVIQVCVSNIIPNPQQPRHSFDPESLLSLSQSIKHNGILQPLTVREMENGVFELVAGERRLRAAIMAGYTMVPCIAVMLDDTQSAVMSLLENLQREDLNFFDEAIGIAKLIERWGMTQEEIALKLGKGQSTVANKLRLLRISHSQRTKIIELGLTERHARALLRLNEDQRNEALMIIEKQGLNVEETDKLVDAMLFPQTSIAGRRSLTVIKDVRIFFNTINNAIDVMKRSGIDAVAQRQEYDDYYEYTVKIPKTQKSVEKLA